MTAIDLQPPVIQLNPNRRNVRWHNQAIALRAAGVGRRAIADELGVNLSQVAVLFSEKVRENKRRWQRAYRARMKAKAAAKAALRLS